MVDDPQAIRRAQLREAKQRQRAKEAAEGAKVLTVKLTAAEFALVAQCMSQQRGPVETALARVLVAGAKFVANSGVAKGRKVKGAA
jgi:hypothetical protein